MAFDAIHQNDTIHTYGSPADSYISYFKNSYAYIWEEATSLNSVKGLLLNMDARQTHTISFTVPKLECWEVICKEEL